MTMQRWEPFREALTLRNAMDRLFEDSFELPAGVWIDEVGGRVLPVDVYQTDENMVLKASLPGFKPEEVEISLTGDTLTIKGEHQEQEEVKEENYLVKERRYGVYSRTMTLPVEIQSEKAEATFENGVLSLTLPKAEEAKPRQIKIQPKAMLKEDIKK
jgi:HSP20 family protein